MIFRNTLAAALLVLIGVAQATPVATAPVATGTFGQATELVGNNSNAGSFALGAPVALNTVVDFKLTFDGAIDGNDFFSFWFGAGSPDFGLKGGKLFVRIGSQTKSSVSDLELGDTVHLFAYLEKVGNSGIYNRFSLWIDPTADEMASLTGADLVASAGSNVTSFNQIGFRTSGLDADDVVTVDSLNVSVVPEPGSLALAGLALLGLGLSRRRSR